MSYPRERILVEYLIPSSDYEGIFRKLKTTFQNTPDTVIQDFQKSNPSNIIVGYDSSDCLIEPSSQISAWGTEYKPLSLHDFVSAFEEDESVEAKPLSSFIDIAILIYESVETPVLANGREVFEMKEPIVPNENVHSLELDHFPWLTFFSPERVEHYSREKLLATPAPRVEELDDGSIVIVTRNPLRWEDDSKVAEHLGIPSAKQYLESV